MRVYIETTGKRYDRLLVKQDLGGNKAAVVCDCGVEKIVDRRAMMAGRIRSCGCLNRELSSARFTTHGLSQTRFHNIWKGMKRRCEDPKSKGWPWYGGKGIRVCERWQDFNNFVADMYDTYQDGFFIDRIKEDQDYEDYNCRWVSPEEQFPRKLSTEQIQEIIEDPRSQPEIAEDYGVSRSYISMLKSGRARPNG